MRYFKKVYPRQPFIRSNGGAFFFPVTESGDGAVATDDAKLIKDFELGIAKKIGGVFEVTEAEFNELKKKLPPPNRNETVSPSKMAEALRAASLAAAARAAKPTQFTPVSRIINKPDPARGRLQQRGFKPNTIDRP